MATNSATVPKQLNPIDYAQRGSYQNNAAQIAKMSQPTNSPFRAPSTAGIVPVAPAPTATPTTNGQTPTAGLVPAAPAPAPTAHAMPSPEIPGLINIQPEGYRPPSTPQGPTSYEAATYEATPDVVSPEETVQHQVNQIVQADSPLMQQAARIAREQANARGLLNSSLAVGHGHQAVIQSALPIAQQDANTFAAARRATNESLNQAGQFNTGQVNTARAAELEAANRIDLTNIQGNIELEKNRENNLTQQIIANIGARTDLTKSAMSQETQLAIANLDAGVKQFLGQLDANNRQLLQTNASAASMFQNVVDNLAKIAVDTEMSAGAKADATQTQLNLLNESLRQLNAVAVTDQKAIDELDLSSFFMGTIDEGVPGSTGTTPSRPTGLISSTNQERERQAEEERRQRDREAAVQYNPYAVSGRQAGL